MASIRLDNVSKQYSGGHPALDELSLHVAEGELLVLVGPSGCGKSTTLRLVAGLEHVTHGRVLLGERDVTDLPPAQRDVAMVFQNYALYPHQTVRGNLAFGLRLRGAPARVVVERVTHAARALGLESLLERKPAQLSGGERQRVALGRALVRQPQAFLLDEPLSNLDAQLRVQARAELARLHRQVGATMLYVTHDQEEALTLGDRVAVLRDGRLQQVASPGEVYRRPANVFVAGFVGSPAMNFFPCRLGGRDGKPALTGSTIQLTLDSPLCGSVREEVVLGMRPQDLRLVPLAEADVTARVDAIQARGSDVVLCLDLPAMLVVPSDTDVRIADRVGLHFPRERLHLFDGQSGARLSGLAKARSGNEKSPG